MSRALLVLCCLFAVGDAHGQATGNGTGLGTAGNTPQVDLDASRTQELSILEQLQGIDEQLGGVQGELVALEERVQMLEQSRADAESDLAQADGTVDGQRDAVADQIAVLYRLHRQGLARVIFGAEDPADLRRRGAYLMQIVDADLRRVGAFKDAIDARREALAAVDRDVRALDALRADLEAKAAELKDQREKRIALLEDIRGRRELTLKAMGEMRDVRQSLGDRLGREKEIDSGAAAAAVGQRPATPPGDDANFRASYGRLSWPVSGRIQKAVLGQGVDIAAEYGTPVRTVYPGVVRLAGYVRGYGQTVAVQHGAYKTVYAHLAGIRVRQGQRVTEGDVLGLVGNTGLTDGDGYVLTFEIRYNGTKQDPRQWLQPR